MCDLTQTLRKNKQFKIKLFKKNIYIFTKKKRKRNLVFAYLHIEESCRIQNKQTTFREKETSISKNIPRGIFSFLKNGQRRIFSNRDSVN